MAFKFAKKAAGAPAEAEKTATSPQKTSSALANLPKSNAPVSGASSTVSWAKRGKAASEEMVKAEQQAAMRKAERDKLWRFWMEPETTRTITFLDGNPDADGMLDCMCYYEHNVPFNGSRENFVCTAEQEGHCVICDSGKEGSNNALVGFLTIIDHTQHKIKQGKNAGKTIVNQRKAFVPKREIIKVLSKQAVKRGGLRGCTFEVSRGNDRTANTGNSFEFIEKLSDEELMAKYDLKPEDIEAADFEKEVTYRTNDQLVELGVGKNPTGPGYESKTKKAVGKTTADEL